MDREHIVQLSRAETEYLRGWLQRPNGSCVLGRACFEAVENGGLLVRTRPYQPPWESDLPAFALIRGDDWEALYVYGVSVSQCHRHQPMELLQLAETHGFSCSTLFTRFASDEDDVRAAESGAFPRLLSELQSTLADA